MSMYAGQTAGLQYGDSLAEKRNQDELAKQRIDAVDLGGGKGGHARADGDGPQRRRDDAQGIRRQCQRSYPDHVETRRRRNGR